jgi:transcriptional regulator with GAF, ATPase, and Fis domain
MANQELVTRAFVDLADTLVDDYDVIDFLQVLTSHCTELLGPTEAGVALADEHGRLHVLASSSERMRLMELIEVQSDDGPCLDVWRVGDPVRSDRLADDRERWPRFAPAALEIGFRSVYAIPLRLRNVRIGALNLFGHHEQALSIEDQVLAQAMADVATIGILHERFLREQHDLADQLQAALTSRITIEQAKGVIAEQRGVDVDDAFTVLRAFARRHGRRLADVAGDVVHRRLSLDPADNDPSERPG